MAVATNAVKPEALRAVHQSKETFESVPHVASVARGHGNSVGPRSTSHRYWLVGA